MAITYLSGAAPPLKWGCEDSEEEREHERGLWDQIYQRLGIETDTGRHADVQTSVSEIARRILDHFKREADSKPSISDARSTVRRYEKAAKEFISSGDALIMALRAGFGAATDDILGSSTRQEESKRASQAKVDAITKASVAVKDSLNAVGPEHLGEWMTSPVGASNIVKNVEGPALRKLVEECLGLWARFRSDKATPTRTGDFYNMCLKVNELITGNAEEPGDLKHHVDLVLKVARSKP